MEVVKKYLDGPDDEKYLLVAILISLSRIIVCTLVIMFMLMAITRIDAMNGKEYDDFKVLEEGTIKMFIFMFYTPSYTTNTY